MFLILLGGSLTFGAALLATVIYTDGALVALRTAAEIIGWLLLLATVAGLVGMRRAGPGPACAASVTLCSGLAALYMSYFFEWHEAPRAPIRLAAAESFSAENFYVRAVPVAYKVMEPVMRPAEVPEAVKVPQPRRKPSAAVRPVTLAANACSTVTGVESVQCDRCADKLGLAWVACQESVRLQYCETELGDEGTCPSPIPASYPG
jgi:hypothetical protein